MGNIKSLSIQSSKRTHEKRTTTPVQPPVKTQLGFQTLMRGQMDSPRAPLPSTPALSHRAGEESHESETRYLRLVARMSAVIFELAPDGSLLSVNEAVSSVVGYQPDELRGKNWWDALCLGEQRRRAADLVRRFETGDVTRYALALTAKDGSPITLEIDSANHYRADGTLERIVCCGIDRTPRTQTEKKLQESEARFRKLAETTSAAIYILHGTQIHYANPAATFLTGHAREELAGINFWELAHPQYRAILKQNGIAKQWVEDIPARYELKFLTKAGEERWVDVTASTIEFEGVRVIVATVFDITERNRAEEALRQAHGELEVRIQERTAELGRANAALRMELTERKAVEEALRQERNFVSAVVDTVSALVVVLDREGRIVRFNRACERVTGYSFDQVKGKPFWEVLLIPEQIQPVRAVFEALRGGQFPSQYENHWLARDGSRRLIRWTNTALLDPNGSAEYVIGTGIDITEYKRAVG